MDMLTVALVVFACAIVVFFSREFGNSVKKIMAIPGMKLLLPLILISILVVYFEPEILWVLTRLQYLLLILRNKIAATLPFNFLKTEVASLVLLMAIPFLPALAFNLWYKRKNYNELRYLGVVICFSWLIIAVLLHGVFQ